MITRFEVAYSRTYRLNHAHAFMAQYGTFSNFRDIALEDMQVRATDGRVEDTNDSIGRFIDDRCWNLGPALFARPLIGECFHDGFPFSDQNQQRLARHASATPP